MKLRLSLLALSFLLSFGLRLSSLEPAFQADDSPETILSGAVLGIQHPPSYPLVSLLGHCASQILPGGPAIAQNIEASLWASLSVALLCLAFWIWTRDDPASLFLYLALSFLPSLAYQAASAKGGIYTLNLLLSVSSLLCFRLYADNKKEACLRLGFLFLGLGLAGHFMSILLFLPAYFLWSKGAKWRECFWLLPGLSLYLFLPLRAAQHPFLNWGDPESAERFMANILRQQYSVHEKARDLANLSELSRHFLQSLVQGLALPILLLGLIGFILAWRNQRLGLRPLLIALLLHLAAVLLYNNPPSGSPWVIDAFFLPEFVAWVFFASFALSQISHLRPKLGLPLQILALLPLLLVLPSQFRASDYSEDYLAYDYSRDLQALLPPHAILLAAGGFDAFGFWYLQGHEKRREDLNLIDVPLLSDWYLEQLSPRVPELQAAWSSREELLDALLQSHLREPLYYSSHNPGDRGIPLGLVSYAPAPGASIALNTSILAAPWPSLRQRFLDLPAPLDPNRRELLGYYATSAQALFDFGSRYHNAALQQYAMDWKQRFSPSP